MSVSSSPSELLAGSLGSASKESITPSLSESLVFEKKGISKNTSFTFSSSSIISGLLPSLWFSKFCFKFPKINQALLQFVLQYLLLIFQIQDGLSFLIEPMAEHLFVLDLYFLEK